MASQNYDENGTRTGLRGRAGEAIGSARDRTGEAYRTARERAGTATRSAGEQIGNYPVGALIGGFALGAVFGAMLPSTRREKELLGDAGHRITDKAREAARQAAEAGRDQIDKITGRAVNEVGSAMVEAVGGKE